MSLTATLTAQSDYSNSSYSFSSGANFYSVVSDTNDSTYAYGTDNFETVDQWEFLCEFTDMPAAVGIDSVTVTIRAKDGSGVSGTNHVAGQVRVGSTTYTASSQATSGSSANYTFTWSTNPSTSAPWTQAQVNAARFGAWYDVTGFPSPGARIAPEVSEVTVSVVYLPKPATLDVSRHLASVELLLRRRPESFLKFGGNLDLLAVSPALGKVRMRHIAAPHPSSYGWGPLVWETRPMALDSIDIDLNAMKATAKLKDMRPVLCLVRDLAYSPKASGVLGDGIARFATPGATWTFTRAAEETFTNPVGESETVPANIPGYADGGLQILAGTRYYVSNNSAARTWSAAQGGFACEVKLTGTISQDRTIAYVYHDTNNWAKVYYDHASTKIKFAIRAAGTTTTITSTTTPISGTWYAVEASWSGSQDENGASYTMTLYINGVVEVSGTASGAMTEVSSSNFDFGSAAGSAELLGLIRKIHSWQYVRNSYESGRNL